MKELGSIGNMFSKILREAACIWGKSNCLGADTRIMDATWENDE